MSDNPSVVYWDHNATSPLRPFVKERMIEAFDRYCANASSAHSMGQTCRAALESARQTLADLLHIQPSELIFTGSATESNLMTLWGLWMSRTKESPRRKTIISSPLEHSSVYENLKFFAEEFGANVVLAPVDEQGQIKVSEFEALLKNPDEIAFCTIIGAQNEIGVIQPWQKLAALCDAKGIPFHVDLVQFLAREPLNLTESKASCVTLCFHKAGGPKGVGLLYQRTGVTMAPLIRGGAQERQRRAGTENLHAIMGAGALAEEVKSLVPLFQDKVRKVRDYFESKLKSMDSRIKIVGEKAPRITNTCFAVFPGNIAAELIMQLDLKNICVSSGSACSSGMPKPSKTLLHLGFSEKDAMAGLRFSMGAEVTSEEADRVLAALEEILLKKKSIAA